MKLTSMKTKIIALIAVVGIILGSFAAFYSPYQASSLGSKILINDTKFITSLLSENLSLGMQSMIFDKGASLEQTIGLLKTNESDDMSTVSNVWVYDTEYKVVASLNQSGGEQAPSTKIDKLQIEEQDEFVVVWSPLYDDDEKIIGYVDIEFSKAFLLAEASQTSFTALWVSLFLVSIVIVIGLFLTTRMTKPITQLTTIAESVSQGDIDVTIDVQSKDEIGKLANSFKQIIAYMKNLSDVSEEIAANNLTITVEPISEKDILGNSFKSMITNLSTIVRQIKENSEMLSSAALQISTSSVQMSKGVNQQNDQMNQVSSSIEIMTATVMESFENTGVATEASKSASETATLGGQLVSDTVIGMQKISDVVRESAQSISKLSQSADKIGEIISVIVDIADQTNLLALNAAIEAARAGEQGRGFAVVADEVRKLAERTSHATGEITDMINGIQSGTDEAVKSMESGIQEIDNGRELADKAGDSLNEIVEMSKRVSDIIHQLADSSEDQSKSAEQISCNVEEIATISKETATGVEQSSTAAEELSRQAESMNEMVAQFKLVETS